MVKCPWLWPLTSTLPFLFGPLLFWTIVSFTQNKQVSCKLIHFVPFFIACLFTTMYLFQLTPEQYHVMIYTIFTDKPPLWMILVNGCKVLLNGMYILFSIRILKSIDVTALSDIHRLWLRTLIVIPTLVLVVFSYVALVPKATTQIADGNAVPFILLAMVMSILIYSISFLVIAAPQGLEAGGIALSDSSKSYVSDEACCAIVEKVQNILASGLYKNETISEAQLAKMLGIHPNRLSLAVNRTLKIPFRRLLNSYRISYVITCIDHDVTRSKTILEVAYEAGFSSKSTFNRVFKEEIGISPREYIRRKTVSY